MIKRVLAGEAIGEDELKPPALPSPSPRGSTRRTVEGVYAQEAFRRLAMNPRDPDALFALAAIHATAGRPADAIATLTLLAETAPFYPGLWRFKARLYREVGDERMAALCAQTDKRLSI